MSIYKLGDVVTSTFTDSCRYIRGMITQDVYIDVGTFILKKHIGFDQVRRGLLLKPRRVFPEGPDEIDWAEVQFAGGTGALCGGGDNFIVLTGPIKGFLTRMAILGSFSPDDLPSLADPYIEYIAVSNSGVSIPPLVMTATTFIYIPVPI